MSRTLRIAALQLRAHDRADFAQRLPALTKVIAETAREHDLVVLPEGTMPAYVLGDDRVDDGLLARAAETLAAIARDERCVIVAGAALRHQGVLYNSALVFESDGSIAGHAEKIFLWHFDRQWFTPGTSLAPISTSIGTLGVLICADGRMPAIAATLVDRGAELLAMPTAWVTSGRDPSLLENIQADLLGRVRAFENNVPFIAANKCGIELEMVAYCGKSQIIDAAGTILAIGSQDEQAVVSAVVTLDRMHPHRHAAAPPQPRPPAPDAPLRVAISIGALPVDITDRLRVLEADLALAAVGSDDFAAFDAAVNAARIGLDALFDPRTLVEYRRAGYRVAIVDADRTHPWLERVARARAAEVRMYAIVFDRQAERAYAVDPDGAVIAGTFGDYRIASFPLDLRRTHQTMIAPGTDIAAGIERVHALETA
ncbi:MAG TPA: carbon-nitrogen hydrolase family protein, partial [Candidatus Aquilonibacter sp.]